MPFLIIFMILPLLELYTFLNVGEEIGLLNTLGICLATAIIGGYLVRKQGLETLTKAKQNLNLGALPLKELFEGLCIVVAGAMLVTPGFITDILGFTLLLPFVRDILRRVFSKYGKFQAVTPKQHSSSQSNSNIDGESTIIEGQYEDLTDQKEKLD